MVADDSAPDSVAHTLRRGGGDDDLCFPGKAPIIEQRGESGHVSFADGRRPHHSHRAVSEIIVHEQVASLPPFDRRPLELNAFFEVEGKPVSLAFDSATVLHHHNFPVQRRHLRMPTQPVQVHLFV